MTSFKVNEELEAVCEWKKTRMAFKHVATLLRNGREIEEVKICYQNRTWESYEYESVLKKLFDKTKNYLTESEQKAFSEAIKNGGQRERDNFKTVAAIASLGDIFGRNDKEKNDWKKRMLEAGLGEKGLMFPEDWGTLSEEDKAARLNGALEQITQ